MTSNQWPESVELARLFILMGDFMDQGHTYEETYEHAIQNTQNEPLRALFREMLNTAEGGQKSPVDCMVESPDVVPRWLFLIFLAGVSSGVPTVWSRGGRAFLKADSIFSTAGDASVAQGNAFICLFLTALTAGVAIDEASRASAECLGLKALDNFFLQVSKQSEQEKAPMAAVCRQSPGLFSPELVRRLAKSETSADPYAEWRTLVDEMIRV